MIALTKQACPQMLENNAAVWRDELCGVLERGEEPTNAQKNRYNSPEVKQALVNETQEKCAYCESKIRHIDDGDIEHIIPKSRAPEMSFDWENLTLACTICNRNKGDYYAEPGSEQELINPYQDDPKQHFLFQRELLTPIPGDLRAWLSEERIELNRAELIERRRENMLSLHKMVEGYVHAEEGFKLLIVRQIKQRYLETNNEYSAFAKKFVEEMVEKEILPADVLD
ncbi:HNH endonuclease [Roseovarius indicus]|uniref:HNH endonuclease n=1 Tax=Roseovarius indicus TaxID=540747 RepID=UPI0032F064B1